MSIPTGTISLIKSAFKDLDLKLPAGYIKGLSEIDNHRDRLEGLRGRDDAALADAVLASLKVGKDPADSEDVRRELARQQMHVSLTGAIATRRLDDKRSELLDKYADGILETMAQTLASIDTILAEARAVMPSVDLAEPTSATSVNPKDLPLWGSARATLAKVDRIAQTWKIMASALNRGNTDPRHLPLIVADLSADELTALGHNPSASSAALAGHHLELATFETIAERKARIAGDFKAAQDARPTFEDTYRRTHGIGHTFKAPA